MKALVICFLAILVSCAPQSTAPALLPLPKEVRMEGCWVKAAEPETVWVDSIPGARLNAHEAYRLTVRRSGIRIEAVTEKGRWNALQTLSQLTKNGKVPCCTITDWPSFRVRGWMMDAGRTYISLDELYREVDVFSRFKLNVFHLHLTENDAWRMESKKYPQLNAPENMTRQPGLYYTQEQLRALDSYCRERSVTLVPEIDMPGHSAAFERAFGFGMQTPEGLAIVKELMAEVMEVFSSEYIHIGTDEAQFTAPGFVPQVVAFMRSHGRKAVSWNPGWKYAPGEIDATQLWSYRGKAQKGIPAVDCRLHYINHFDLFGDIIGLHSSRIYYADEGSEDLAGSIICLWNDRFIPDEEEILRSNNLYAAALALADRAWRGGGWQYFDDFGAVLPEEGPAREDFLDFEGRLLPQLEGLPSSYVEQGDAHWVLSPVYPNGGNLEAVFPPEEGKWETERMVSGSGIYLRHVWGPSIVAGVYPDPQPNSTVYARAQVYSSGPMEAGLLFETQNHSRSEWDAPAPQGQWDHRHSRLWINGEEVLPPVKTIRLNKGWNDVLVKLPVGAFSTLETRLVKWNFTCAFTTDDGSRAAPLKYKTKF
ncbi:MAG: family 20 glycosylhydrolase [Bacteroidales bacterium]|nr:family 20 glycosylhydrolase [Bacteroidales bacterium]